MSGIGPSEEGPRHGWLEEWLRQQSVPLWGAADLRAFDTPQDDRGKRFPFALSLVFPLDPLVMESVQQGPTEEYASSYAAANERINAVSVLLAGAIRARGSQARALAASERTDPIGLRGEFPHKTAATRAGLGWIGRHCQLITRSYGPWVRLGTVFTDLDLTCGAPAERGLCGRCLRCVTACPAGALKGKAWSPGLDRGAMLDAAACDQWKKERYFRFQKGRVCGICSAVCPYGLKVLRRRMHGP